MRITLEKSKVKVRVSEHNIVTTIERHDTVVELKDELEVLRMSEEIRERKHDSTKNTL